MPNQLISQVNGRLQVPTLTVEGSTTRPGLVMGPSQGENDGFYFDSTNGGIAIVFNGAIQGQIDGGATRFATVNLGSAGAFSFGATTIYSPPDVGLLRTAAGVAAITDGSQTSTNYKELGVATMDFRQVASTFAQAATIGNGPRAAAPVAWVEVKVAGSTGRIPVW